MKEHEFDLLTTCNDTSVSAPNMNCYGPKEEKLGFGAIYYLLRESSEKMLKEDYDLIFTTRAIFASILPGRLISLFKTFPWVADCDDYEWYGRVHSKLGPALIKSSDALTVASRELHRLLGGIYITNSTDPEEFNPSKYDRTIISEKYKVNPEKVIIWSGVIDRKVNLRFLAGLSKKIEESRDDACFVIMGDGEKYGELRGMLSHDLNKTILTGWVKKPELYRWYAAANIGIFSFSDNKYDWCKSPIKLPEYMAMNLAVFTTPVGEPKYIVKEVGCGEVCYGEDDMLEKIRARSINELREMGRKGRMHIVKHPLHERAEELNRVFKRVVTRS